MFTPVVEQQVSLVQGATGFQEHPKPQRSPRKKKNTDWTLNQKQFDHSKTQEISHILPGKHLNVFNGEDSVSYLQMPVKKRNRKTVFVPDVVKRVTDDAIAKQTHGANFVIRIPMLCKLVASMKNV